MNDPHQVLGVAPGASHDDIKRAYRRLAMRYHPDHNPDDPAAENKFKEVTAAYEAIRHGRADRQTPHGDPSAHEGFQFHAGPFTAADMMEAMRARATGRNRDIEAVAMVSLEDSFNGATITVHVPTANGTRTTTLDLPRGVDVQHRVRVPDAGDRSFPSLRPGNLNVSVRFHPHPLFTRRGNDLHAKIAVPVFDVLLGGETQFRCIDGREINLSIPRGAQPGQHLRVTGQGMPLIGTPDRRGDLFIELGVACAPLSDEQIALIEQARALQTAS